MEGGHLDVYLGGMGNVGHCRADDISGDVLIHNVVNVKCSYSKSGVAKRMQACYRQTDCHTLPLQDNRGVPKTGSGHDCICDMFLYHKQYQNNSAATVEEYSTTL